MTTVAVILALIVTLALYSLAVRDEPHKESRDESPAEHA